jgi:hypothetical protein
MKACWSVFLLFVAVAAVRADGPGDNDPGKVRQVPPPGIKLPEADRKGLEGGVKELGLQIEALRADLKGKPALLELLPDVQVYHNAVRYALTYNEFFHAREIPVGRALLKQGLDRAQALRDGKVPWTTATGLVVRGYVSKIDGSVQPYGLVVPRSYKPDSPHQHRLDIWFHGRVETLSELNFINGRQTSPGEFTPKHAFVLHPYGRYCNANKFAGEIDTLEALAHVKKHYPIDEDRIVARGFSMGGAACWQFAVHYPGLWAAAAPGAGFSETADFLKVFQKEKLEPTWYERKLWHLYDCTDYALNIYNVPTVAYSGEIDSQKQAADMMAEALQQEGIKLAHIIGPKTGHSYHPRAKAEINRRIDRIVKDSNPTAIKVRFTTWTLRYNQAHWLRIDELEQHWERARVEADIMRSSDDDEWFPTLKTKNVSALTLLIQSGILSEVAWKPRVKIDHEKLEGPAILSDRSWTAHLRKKDGKWTIVDNVDDGKLRKRHGLQGPIDDAFMDNFMMVSPTGKPINAKVGKWVDAEMAHAIEHWRRQFRGETRVKKDADITDADIADYNLVLWGDPSSNKVLAKIAAKLPIRWDAEGVHVDDKTYAAGHHVPVLIYPNPLNPKRYVVLNSGFTFREYDYLNNARQVPKLPDWAVVDVNVPVSSRAPGGIVNAGFFGEEWEYVAPPK